MRGPSFNNPGDGFYRVTAGWMGRFETVQIVQTDPDVPLAGMLIFRVDQHDSGVIDLAAGRRFLGLPGGRVAELQMEAAGLNPADVWALILS